MIHLALSIAAFFFLCYVGICAVSIVCNLFPSTPSTHLAETTRQWHINQQKAAKAHADLEQAHAKKKAAAYRAGQAVGRFVFRYRGAGC